MMAAAAGAASISLEGVGKTFAGTVLAVDGIDLAIAAGEFFALLGPSGCGKTTTLRMIAGFEMPDRGRILVAGRDITRLPVHRRDMGMIFQSYALFPHRTVWENVAFGLRMRRLPRSEIAARVRDALRQVALAGLEDRRPGQLSGGQQQRVALARALVIRPSVLLCDEPLGALDRKLRQQMQFELKRLQKELGVTLVFVTHDQEEALAMSDRIAVMNAGRVEQVGTPGAVYATPRTRFVAGFIGETNIFEGRFDGVRFVADDGRPLPAPPAAARAGAAAIAIRPEKMRIVADGEGILPGRIETANYLGDATLYRISGEGGRVMLAKETNLGRQAAHAPGEAVALAWGAEDAVVLED